MNSVLLGDVVSITGGGTPSRDVPAYYGGSIPWITVKDFGERLFLDGAQETITEAGLENSATRLIPAGSVILVTRMNVGAVAINRVPVAINQDLKALLCKTDLDPLYLLFFMLSKRDQLSAGATGATVKGITLEDVVSLELPLPPLAEQRRIAAILRAVDDERRRRRYTQSLSDGLLGEVFVRMFGDPATNPMGWDARPLQQIIAAFDAGINFAPVTEGERASRWRVLKVSAVTWDDFDPDESKPISADVVFDDSLIVRRGDLLMSRANTTELVGAVCIVRDVPSEVILPDKIWRIRFRANAQVMPDYVLYALRHPGIRRIIGNLASGSSGSMKNISMEKALTIELPLPPLSLQSQFAAIVAEYEQIRHQQRESERQSDHLFDTLLHQAFAGEL